MWGYAASWGRPFRFEAAGITHPDYRQLVVNAWNRNKDNFVTSLNNVREDSLVFNREVFGNIRKKKREIENRLKGIWNSLESIDSARLVYLERQLQQEYDALLFQEELHWYQKSRDNWIKLGTKILNIFMPKQSF